MTSYDERVSIALEKSTKKILSLQREIKHLKQTSKTDDFAIIGMDGLFPGEDPSLSGFWKTMLEGRDAISEVNKVRWYEKHIETFNFSDEVKKRLRTGGFLQRDIRYFDPQFFGISPKEAYSLDPEHRILLELTWCAIENAGINPQSLKNSHTGVFIGSCLNDYQLLINRHQNEIELSPYIGTGVAKSVLAGRISHVFGFKGPTVVVDTACSSSLVSVHLACQSLANRESDMTIAGGVNLILLPDATVTFSNANMLSKQSRCFTFDKRADGYVRGEGAGLVIIKRLSDAIDACDRIIGVIKGSAVNHDGKSSGLTVPNIDSQVDVIESALSKANLTSDDIDVIEAHGTGTKLGDPIEINAIKRVFQNRARPLLIGSIKSSIGHLESAAGIISLIKMLLCLENQYIPKQCNFNEVNPIIQLDEIPAVIPQEKTPWAFNKNHIRRAAISSFGFSGTNAHLILEEHIQKGDSQSVIKEPYLFCFSGRTEKTLNAYLNTFKLWLIQQGQDKLAAISYTLNTGRAQFAHRRVIITDSITSLLEQIDKEDHNLEIDASNPLIHTLSTRFLEGEQVDFEPLYETKPPKIVLPNTQFEKEKYWVIDSEDKQKKTSNEKTLLIKEEWFKQDKIALEKLTRNTLFLNVEEISSLNSLTQEELSHYARLCIPLPTQESLLFELIQGISQLISLKHIFECGIAFIYENEKGSNTSSYVYDASVGIVKTLLWEAPKLKAYLVEIDEPLEIYLERPIFNPESHHYRLQKNTYYCPKLIQTKQNRNRGFFNSEGTHWITGGTGSLGLMVCELLVELGVNSIILSSRRGMGEHIDARFALLKLSGVQINIVKLDMSNEGALKRFIEHHKNSLKGIYHLAGINNHAAFNDVTRRDLHDALMAKAKGAYLLDKLTSELRLNCFVFFSSISSLLGSYRQTPYVLANTYLDRLASRRKEQGKPMLSINWGPFEETELTKRAKMNMGLLSQTEGKDKLRALLLAQEVGLGVLDEAFLTFMFGYFENKTSFWLKGLSKYTTEDINVHQNKLIDLKKLSHEKRDAFIQGTVRETIADVLGLSDVHDNDIGFFDLGMDSLMSVEVAKTLEHELGVSLKPTVAFDYNNIKNLSRYISNLFSSTQSIFIDDNVKTQSPISIIGMSCCFPGGANDLNTFWKLLCEGKNGITEIPNSRFDIREYYSEDKTNREKMHTKYAALIDNIETFDPSFFGISQREAQFIDPQQRMVLEETWHALEDAGIKPGDLKGKRVGIYIALSQNEYGIHLVSKQKKDIYQATGSALNIAAGRLAYFLGTQGAAMVIDTACSSSLVAINEAAQALAMKECEIAIVAGVNAVIDPNFFIALSNAEMLSEDGQCKTFDSNANGYVRGEGCGVVILKPKDKLLSTNKVWAHIRGSMVNQDGASSGLTVPNGVSQMTLIKSCLKKADLKPDDISYIEAHGTGTALGDPIEIGALTEVFKGRDTTLVIGSVKTNIGHLESASGIAGVIKSVLMLSHQCIPKHLNFKTLNPAINLEQIPAEIPVSLKKWEVTSQTKRYCGVSSFGFSGTNAHIILEEAPIKLKNENIQKETPLLFCFSAKTKRALDGYLVCFANWLRQSSAFSTDLEEISATLNLYRTHFPKRAVIVASTLEALIQRIETRKCFTIESLSPTHSILYEKGQAYLEGKTVTFETLYSKSIKPITMPGYLFDKTRCWLASPEKEKSESQLNFFLRHQSYHHVEELRLFTSEISEIYPSFVEDHKIYDIPVIAGASYLSILISYLVQIEKKTLKQLKHIQFIKPLVIQKGDVRQLQFSISPKKDKDNFYILSYEQERPEEYITHAEGCIVKTDNTKPKSFDIEGLLALHVNQYDTNLHVSNCLKKSLSLGHHFHWLDNVKYAKNSLIATFREPDESELNGYELYPGLIDAGFQSMFPWFLDEKKDSLLPIPISIDEMSVSYKKNPVRYVYIERDITQETADIYYLDKGGRCVVSVVGYKAQSISPKALKNIIASQSQETSKAYYIDWQTCALQRDNKTSALVDEFQEDINALIKAVDKERCHQQIIKKNNEVIFFITKVSISKLVDAITDFHQMIKKVISESVESITVITLESCLSDMLLSYLKTLSQEYPMIKVSFMSINDFGEVSYIANGIAYLRHNKNNESILKCINGQYFVPRLLNKSQWEKRHTKLSYPSKDQYLKCEYNIIDTLYWENETDVTQLVKPIRVDVKYTSLNFRDILKLMGTYPGDPLLHQYEQAGVVSEVKHSNAKVKVGDKVLILNQRKLSSSLLVEDSDVLPIPEELSLSDACSIPAVFLTAFISLYKIAKLKKGEKVLIHAASGGVGLACIQLAKERGAEIYATASEFKQSYLKSLCISNVFDSRKLGFGKQIKKLTKGRGVDLVINSLTGQGFIEESLTVLKFKGTFIELSKRHIFSVDEMKALRPDVDYHIFLLDSLMKKEPDTVKNILNIIFEYLKSGVCQPLPKTFFDITEAQTAFNYLKKASHIGKVILKHTNKFHYYDNKSYLITGGLGAISRDLVQHLVSKKVKHIVLLGRKNISSKPEWIMALSNKNVSISYHKIDLADRKAVREIILKLHQRTSLAGVFHLAGVLKDSLIQHMTAEQMREVFVSKLIGAYNLHLATEEIPLDCFVMFSSISSVMGSVGQANYASANAFMDALSFLRKKQSLASLSINWGTFDNRGMAYDHLKKHASKGLKALKPSEAFHEMDIALTEPSPQVTIADFDWNTIAAFGIDNPFLKQLQKTFAFSEDKHLDIFQEKDTKKRLIILREEIKKILSEVLMIEDPSQIDNDCNIFELGIDSLMFVDMTNKLQRLIGRKKTLNYHDLSELNTVRHLSSYINNHYSEDTIIYTDNKVNDKKPTFKKLQDNRNINIQHLFLTGATGVLGSYLLKDLIQCTNSKIHCLVRGNNLSHAYERIKNAINIYSEIPYNTEDIKERVSLYLGDVKKERLGLDSSVYQSLTDTIDMSVHAASNLSLQEDYENLYDVNVLGTKHLIDFSLSTKHQAMLYVSSYSVMGNRVFEKDLPFYERDFDLGQHFENLGYQKTKFESEKLVRKAGDKGLNWWIVRPGDIYGDSNSGAYPLYLNKTTSIFYDLFKTMIETRLAMLSPLHFDMTPVDYVSRGILHIINTPHDFFDTFHLVNPKKTLFPQIIKYVREYGYPVECISQDEYVLRVFTSRIYSNGKPYESITTKLIQLKTDLFLSKHGSIADATWSQKHFEKAGIQCPPVNQLFISTLLNYCVNQGYLSQPNEKAKDEDLIKDEI